MAGRIWIGPYKPLGVSSQPLPGGGYLSIDARAGRFEPSPLLQLGLQAAEGAAGIVTAVSEHLANDNEAAIKAADIRLGEAEQALLFGPHNGYLNLQGQAALTKAPAVLDAYREAQDRELAETADDDQHGMLQGLNERRLASFTTLVERHTDTERQRWYDEAGERRIAQMQADAGLHWRDDALLRRALGTTRVEVREKAVRKGWDATLTEAMLRQHTSRTLAAAIGAAVEHDPDRAQSLRSRYDQHIEAAERAELDALLTEAQTRRRADAASAEILNATPPDGEASTPQWRLRQAEAITDPTVRAATVRRLNNAAAAEEARARALAEQVLERVLKDGLTDPSQISVREWVTLDAEHRQAIETRLDHNARDTEPAANPALVDELATQMTQAPDTFVRRDLVPTVAHLPLPQWQRFHNWQAGIRRNDPATEDQLDAIRRGLQLATKALPADTPDDSATNHRAELVEEIDTWRRINGKSPDDDVIREMVERTAPSVSFHTVKFPFDPQIDPPLHLARLPVPRRTERQAIELLQLLWLLWRGIVIGVKADQDTRPPGRPNAPTLPPPADGWPSTGRTSRPASPQVAAPPTARDQLPPEVVKELTKPEVFPADDGLSPSPPPHVPPPPLPTIEGIPIPPPQRPSIIWTPILPPQLPQIIERRSKRWDDDVPWEKHHHIPQEWWQYGKEKRLPFSPAAVKFFDEQIVEIPKDEHWSDLHKAYNEAAGKALKDYLEKNKRPDETWKKFASRMSREEAQECFKHMINAILNPSSRLTGRAAEVAKQAKEFLENVSEYVPKRKAD